LTACSSTYAGMSDTLSSGQREHKGKKVRGSSTPFFPLNPFPCPLGSLPQSERARGREENRAKDRHKADKLSKVTSNSSRHPLFPDTLSPHWLSNPQTYSTWEFASCLLSPNPTASCPAQVSFGLPEPLVSSNLPRGNFWL
jgi:hypothetical protein